MGQWDDDWSEADQLLMGGGKVRSATWGAPKSDSGMPPDKVPGFVEEGLVVERPDSRQQTGAPGTSQEGQLLFWENNNKPKMQVIVKIQTAHRVDEDDDGIRAIYIKGGELQKAVVAAVTKAGGKRIEVGGMLRVRFIRKAYENGQYKNYWAAQYELPAQVAVDEFFGTEAPPLVPLVPAQRADDAQWAAPSSPAPQQAPQPAAPANADMMRRLREQQERGVANLQANRAAAAEQRTQPAATGWENSQEPPF